MQGLRLSRNPQFRRTRTVNFPVTLPAGLHLIEIQAEDPAGNVGDDTVQVTATSTTD